MRDVKALMVIALISSVLLSFLFVGTIRAQVARGAEEGTEDTGSQTGPQYTLTVMRSGTGQGKILNNSSGNTFRKGTWVTLRAIPEKNSFFSGWNGACSGTSAMCRLQMTSDKSVTAVFGLRNFTIEVRQPANGVIYPSGLIRAAPGEKRNFQIIPLPGYRVADVRVDRVSVGAVNTYTFSNIKTNHVLEAVFVKY